MSTVRGFFFIVNFNVVLYNHKEVKNMFRFKECREKAGFTQKEAAFSLGVSVQSISNWENEVRKPSLDQLVNIAELYGVTTDCLLGRESLKVELRHGKVEQAGDGDVQIRFEPAEQANEADMEKKVMEMIRSELKKRGL